MRFSTLLQVLGRHPTAQRTAAPATVQCRSQTFPSPGQRQTKPMVPTLPQPCPTSDHLIASPTPTSHDVHNPCDTHTSPLTIPIVPTLPHSCPTNDHIIASLPHSSHDAQDPCDSHNSPLDIPFPHLVAPSRVEHDIPNSLPMASDGPL
jgi:hypothetical protein